MTLLRGLDSSTQSNKAGTVTAEAGTVVEQPPAPHPPGPE